jgi:hypothetical protein
MAQEKFYRLSHFVPDGHPQVHPGSSSEVKEMMPYLIEKVPRGWTAVPGRADLELFATRQRKVPILGFKKNKKEVYVHIFCNEFMDPLPAVNIVINLYVKYKLGNPVFIPKEPNWIHTIPIPGANLNQAETLFIHQLTQSLFWTIYMDYKKRLF